MAQPKKKITLEYLAEKLEDLTSDVTGIVDNMATASAVKDLVSGNIATAAAVKDLVSANMATASAIKDLASGNIATASAVEDLARMTAEGFTELREETNERFDILEAAFKYLKEGQEILRNDMEAGFTALSGKLDREVERTNVIKEGVTDHEVRIRHLEQRPTG
jgi:hypothetical protein